MGRRLMWDRSAIPGHVLSASEESGLLTDVPAESSTSGRMELLAGGSPSDTYAIDVDLLRGGNLGDSEWGWGINGETPFFGANTPWIVDRPYTDVERSDVINIPHRLFADRDNRNALCVFVRNLTLDYRIYDVATQSWGARKNIATVAAASKTADGTIFEDTGEAVVFCNGVCYSTFDTSDAATWIEKGSFSSWGAGRTHETLVQTRGLLVILFLDTGDIKASVSSDRGATWGSIVTVSDNFTDTITAADSIHAVVSPLDLNIYLIVEDDIGLSDTVKVYRSLDGLAWEQTNADVASWSGDEIENVGLTAMDDGNMVALAYNSTNNVFMAAWLGAGGKALDRTGGRDSSADDITATTQGESMQAVDIGNTILATSMISAVGGSNQEVINGLFLRWWSNITEKSDYDLAAWFNNSSANPSSGWDWTQAGAGSEALGTQEMSITSSVAGTRTFSQSFGVQPIGKIKFAVLDNQNSSTAQRTTGVRAKHESAAAKGYDFGVYIDATTVLLRDHTAAADVTSAARDCTVYNDFLIDIDFDNVNGGAEVTVWARSEANGYPADTWTRLFTASVTQGAPFAGVDSSVEWGNHAFSGTTISDWYYILVGNTSDDLDDNYKNTNTDHSSLQGRFAVSQAQEIADQIRMSFRGAGGYTGDRWLASSSYQWPRGNVLRSDPKRQWRTDTDEQEVSLVFYRADLAPFRPDWLALIGINFDQYYIEADDASTFDSGGGAVPEFSMRVRWGTLSGDDAVSHICNDMQPMNVAANWLQFVDAEAKEGGMWKGRFDKDNIAGRGWFLRILEGGHAGEVYRIESIEMLDDGGGASWQVRLGAAPDGTLPNLLSGTPMTTSDAVGIFGDAIAIELPPSTFFRQSGYKYLRIRIENQTTWDGDYRIGFAMWGMSAPLGSPLGVNGPLVQKISEPEWGSALSTIPNVAAVRQPDGTTNKRRKGRAPREIPLSWSGQAGRDSWQNVVRGVIEAASSDTPIVFMENDTFQHDGRISPAGTPSHVCYDPILCYLDGIIQTKHDAYHMYDGRWDANQMRGVVASVSGIVLREIV